jgi:hypothetical protein
MSQTETEIAAEVRSRRASPGEAAQLREDWQPDEWVKLLAIKLGHLSLSLSVENPERSYTQAIDDLLNLSAVAQDAVSYFTPLAAEQVNREAVIAHQAAVEF